jgi:hypothetical protein
MMAFTLLDRLDLNAFVIELGLPIQFVDLGIDHFQSFAILNHPEVDIQYVFAIPRLEITAGKVDHLAVLFKLPDGIMNLDQRQAPGPV